MTTGENMQEVCGRAGELWGQGEAVQAALLLERCAAKGYAPAQRMLGDFHRCEKGDAWGAVAWYCRAAEQGDAAAAEALRDLVRTAPELRNRVVDCLSPRAMAALGLDAPGWISRQWAVRGLSVIMLAAVPVCLWCFGSYLYACLAGLSPWADASLPLWLSEIGALFFASMGYAFFRQSWLGDDDAGSRPLLLAAHLAWAGQVALLLVVVGIVAAFF